MTQVVEKFVDFYRAFSPEMVGELSQVYDHNVVFEDPIKRIEGLEELKHHFLATMQGLQYCKFEFTRVQPGDRVSYVEWQMHYSHPRLVAGKQRLLEGISVIEASDKVISHRDYYDMGQMVYENVPILGRVVKYVKDKLSGT